MCDEQRLSSLGHHRRNGRWKRLGTVDVRSACFGEVGEGGIAVIEMVKIMVVSTVEGGGGDDGKGGGGGGGGGCNGDGVGRE